MSATPSLDRTFEVCFTDQSEPLLVRGLALASTASTIQIEGPRVAREALPGGIHECWDARAPLVFAAPLHAVRSVQDVTDREAPATAPAT